MTSTRSLELGGRDVAEAEAFARDSGEGCDVNVRGFAVTAEQVPAWAIRTGRT